LTICALLVAAAALGAQGRGGTPAAPPPSPWAAAPIDLTGYWVAVISEDWRWRMVTPAKGDYASIPLTPAGKNAADQWDPAKDEAAGEQCKSYAAPALMRAPTRLHVTWQDDRTLKIDTDYGQQTRRLSFTPSKPGAERTWQGESFAQWEMAPRGRGAAGPASGNLKVVTTNLRPGYLRKNGVPYSANAVLTEYWDAYATPRGDQLLIITSIVHDPENLQTDWLTSLNFKKEPGGAKWDPSPCSTTW
jgi:hypothetical protein